VNANESPATVVYCPPRKSFSLHVSHSLQCVSWYHVTASCPSPLRSMSPRKFSVQYHAAKTPTVAKPT
jgi:hypothetical protein